MDFYSYLAAFGTSALVALATLLPIANPTSTAPIFLSLTEGASEKMRQELARRVARNVFLLMVGATLLGSFLLDVFGISLDIVRAAGGLIVINIGWRLLTTNSAESPRAAKIAQNYTPEMVRSQAFFPLSFPITCGPGTISAAITVGVSLASSSIALSAVRTAGAIVGLAIIALLIFLSYRYAEYLLRLLGDTGTVVFLRLSAFILLCLGIQIFWDGAGNLLATAIRDGVAALPDLPAVAKPSATP
ncbi:NAAT family transporter [Lampropedia puyangensis]|uniref:UPF0056 membrane protein n=1 Tax=Lampropedia puyangensis TaxID=1330072 RepID=A0A4S8F9X0_9BURK|nr:MarC family protein [Lampropedia puyangensis]THU04398.1 NAAT family transporter [Lampropedia puyangensis]